MSTIASIGVMAAIIFAFGATLVLAMSCDAFARMFYWSLDHPVIFGLALSTALAILLVAGGK